MIRPTHLTRGVRPFEGICVEVTEGHGTEEEPVRTVEYRYERTPDGYQLLERRDPVELARPEEDT